METGLPFSPLEDHTKQFGEIDSIVAKGRRAEFDYLCLDVEFRAK